MSEPEPRKPSKYELPRGASVGKYEILRKIATGGMAEIYLARVRGTAGFEKLVVLKRILPQVAEDPSFVQMFLDEARLAATLQHTNIADVYDVGEADGQYFFTMEFVYGQDVRTIRHEMKKRNEPVPLAASLAIIHGTASALDYAHDKRGPDGKLLGLVHRDVSASNVMVSYDGAVKLLDFGIARVMSTTHKTQVGTLKGKIPYMSPEQCKGLPLDRRSDLFSLGVVLYEMTVGRRPFRGESDFAIMDQIVYQGAPKPSSLMTGYPADLEAIVMKLLERDPKARYTTGDELVDDIDALIQKYGLWISPKQLGKYMRTVFADRIKAWEDAEKAGVPFMQHVTESITSQSQQSELVTPPSAFPGIPQRASQVMAAVSPEVAASLRPTPTSMPAVEPPKGIDALHAKLGQKSVAKPGTKPPPPAAPAQEEFDEPDKSGEGWDAPTTRFDPEQHEFAGESPTSTQAPEDIARSLAPDPEASAKYRAAALGERDLGAAPTVPAPPPRPPAPKAPPAPLAARPIARPPSSVDDEVITEKPIKLAPAFVPDPAAVHAPAPMLESQPYPSLKPKGGRALVLLLIVVAAIAAGLITYKFLAGDDLNDAPAASDHGAATGSAAPAAPVVPEPSKATAPEPTPAETKPAEPTPAETKPVDPTPAETRPVETRPAETKPAETKPARPRPVEPKTPPRVAPHPPVAKPAVKTPAPKPANQGSHPSEDATWDPNSPYLPQ